MAVFNVSNAAELKDALSKANGGDEIVLASGDYGHLGLDSKTDFNVKYSSEIVIRSGNSNDPAVFSSMKLGQVENITFDGILFDYEYSSGDTKYSKPFLVTKSENVTIKNSEFRGDVAGSENLGTAQGLNVKESTGVTVESTEFSLWHRGLIVTDSSDIKVLNNDVHSMRSDGLDFAAVQNVLIEGNYIHDFTGSSDPGDHRDFIQFWTNGTDVPSTNVTIRDNILDIGEGSWAQSIFIRNEEVDNGRAGEEMFYQDFVIEGNYIRNVHLHGITTGESNGLTIKDNVLISAEPNLDDTANAYHFDTYGDRSLMRVPTIRVNPESDDVSIKGNQFFGSEGYAERSDDRIFDTQTDKGIDNVPNGWEISNNSIDASSQGPAVPDYASSSSTNNNSDAADDAAAQAAAEAAAQAAAEAAAQAAAEAAAQAEEEAAAQAAAEAAAQAAAEAAAQAEAEAAAQAEAEAAAQAEAEAAAQAEEEAEEDTGVNEETTTEEEAEPQPGSDSGSSVDSYTLDFAEIAGSDALRDDSYISESGGESALRLDGDGDYVDLGRLTEFEESNTIAFSIDYSRDEADGSTSRLVWNHMKTGLTLKDDGLAVHVATADGSFKGFKVKDLGLNDTDEHNIVVMLDADEDRLQIIVDDTVVLDETDTDFDIVGAGGNEWGWSIGSSTKRWFDGEVTAFSVDDDFTFVDDGSQYVDDAPLLG